MLTGTVWADTVWRDVWKPIWAARRVRPLLTDTIWANTVWIDVWGPIWATHTSTATRQTFGVSSEIDSTGLSKDSSMCATFGVDGSIQ